MNSNFKKLVSTCALLGCSAVAQAQLYVGTGSSGATTWLNFSINAGLNQVTVVVDNTHAGTNGATATVTSFGFNVPTGLAAGGSLLSAVGVPAESWSYFAPYNLNNFDQDAGAGSGNTVNGGQPQEGVQFGSSATFVFQFANFDNTTGFLGLDGVSLKWQSLSTTGQGDNAFGNLAPDHLGAPSVLPVPEPSTYGLIGAACLVLGTFARRHMAKAKALA